MHRRKVWGMVALAWLVCAPPAADATVNSATTFDELQPDDGVEPPVFGAFTPPDSRFDVTGQNTAAGFYLAGRGSGWTGSFRAAQRRAARPRAQHGGRTT